MYQFYIEISYADRVYNSSTHEITTTLGRTMRIIRKAQTAASALSAATAIFNALSNAGEGRDLALMSITITSIVED